jgi:hypothetical protein
MEEMKTRIIRLPQIPKWNVEEFCGYEPKTTFWEDFRIADLFTKGGTDLQPIQQTFDMAFSEWKDDMVYLTELSMVLNHSSNFWYLQNTLISAKYAELWQELDEWVYNNWEDDKIAYYFQVTD